MIKIMLQFKGRVLNQFITQDEHITIGRNRDNLIQINNQSVSKYHAMIIKDKEGKVYVEDLNSSNGTYVNEKQIHQQELKNGDEILIGKHTIKIFLADSEAPITSKDIPGNEVEIDEDSTLVMQTDSFKKMLAKQ
ncbi:MAG: FHA domain-containing protein [bacterium]